MPRLSRLLLLLGAVLSLTGCGMLASVYEERTLRIGAMLVVIAAAIGFIVARMRRP